MVGEVEVPVKIHLAGQGRKYLSKVKQLWGPIAKCINRAPEWDARFNNVGLGIVMFFKKGTRLCVTYTSVLEFLIHFHVLEHNILIMQEEQDKDNTQSKALLMIHLVERGKAKERADTGNLIFVIILR